jgi:hypothetical protein
MRMLGMGFGLIGLLICVAIMVKLEADTAPATIQTGNQARQEVQQIAGVTEDGTHMEDTYDLAAQKQADGRIRYLLVTRLQPNSPLVTFFGLKLNDQITVASYESVDWPVNAQDEDSDKLNVREAYTHSGKLTVMRDGQQLTLPTPIQAAQGQAQPGAQPQGQDPNDPMKDINDRLHSLPGN